MPSNEKSIVHIMVIWHSAMKKKKEILQDLNENFQILKVFRGHWNHKKWLDNWFVFYAHSQKHRTYRDFHRILMGKLRLCKKGDFEVIVFNDNNPLFEERETSSGIRSVNTRVFDKKQLYRKWTGGGSQIHGSDDAWETNKDLTIMFGMNTEDFCNFYKDDIAKTKERQNDLKEDSFHKDCVGVNGYKDIQQLFYVLNNTIKYCVLRNHEPIPDQYTVAGHGDIDLLVENKNYIAYLTLAKQVLPHWYRVYHRIKIGNTIVPFDFRAVGDAYYDEPWQQDILASRVFTKNLFYVPNPENQFYTLLYHAYVQKLEVKPDYFPKLEKYGKDIGVSFTTDKENVFKNLDAFMAKNGYEYIRPCDKSVKFNLDNLKYSSIIQNNGYCICRNTIKDSPLGDFCTLVRKHSNSFLKSGTRWLVDNEAKFLKKLSGINYFPQVLDHKVQNNELSSLEISAMPGTPSDEFFSTPSNCNKKNVSVFLNEAISILSILHKNKILHRDLNPDNFLIESSGQGVKVSLIDFGWATDYANSNSPTPVQLCSRYTSKNDKIDPHEFGEVLKQEWGLLPCCRTLAKKLKKANIDELDDDFYDNLKKRYLRFSLFDLLAIRLYSLLKWEKLKMAVQRRTILKARNEKGLWNKLFLLSEFLKRVQKKTLHR